MPVILPNSANRLQFMETMKTHGIQTSIHYPPIHTFTDFRSQPAGPAPLDVTEAIARREVTLPLYPLMTDAQVELVVNAVADALVKAR